MITCEIEGIGLVSCRTIDDLVAAYLGRGLVWYVDGGEVVGVVKQETLRAIREALSTDPKDPA